VLAAAAERRGRGCGQLTCQSVNAHLLRGQAPVVHVARDAPNPVAAHFGFGPVCIEDAHGTVGFYALPSAAQHDGAIRSETGEPVGQLLGDLRNAWGHALDERVDDQVVVLAAVHLRERPRRCHHHAPDERARRLEGCS
jgi:hypothetical protein